MALKIYCGMIPLLVATLLGGGCAQEEINPKAHENLRVMSYNIRFESPNDGPNSWNKRKQQLTNLIQFYAPTFIGTQEGLLHQLQYIERETTPYKWIGIGRDDGTMDGEFSALFYDSTRVQLIAGSEHTIWLSPTPNKPGKAWDADFPRILTYGKFRDKLSGKSFFVLNTHFDHVGDKARINSAKLILEIIQNETKGYPVILIGDFNATPNSKPYKILTSEHSTLKDAYYASEIANVGPSFTFEGFSVRSESDKRRIDYIFTNGMVEVKKHAIISAFNNFSYPSDHLPVIADLKLK